MEHKRDNGMHQNYHDSVQNRFGNGPINLPKTQANNNQLAGRQMKLKPAPTHGYDIEFKIAIVGDSGVGKTSLINFAEKRVGLQKLCEQHGTNFGQRDSKFDRFEQEENSARGSSVGLNIKTVKYVHNDYLCQVQFWDCPGAERYMNLTSRYCAGVLAVIFVYDVNNRYSFENLKRWKEEVEKYSSCNLVKVLVGNQTSSANSMFETKANLNASSDRQVPISLAHNLADELGMDYFETNSSNGLHCEDVFDHLIAQIMDSIPSPPEPSLLLGRNIKIGPKLLENPTFREMLYSQAKLKAKESRERSLFLNWLK